MSPPTQWGGGGGHYLPAHLAHQPKAGLACIHRSGINGHQTHFSSGMQECMSEPTFAQYDVVIIDEAHERSISTDLLLCLLKRSAHSHLKVLIMSATLEVCGPADHPAPGVRWKGRL